MYLGLSGQELLSTCGQLSPFTPPGTGGLWTDLWSLEPLLVLQQVDIRWAWVTYRAVSEWLWPDINDRLSGIEVSRGCSLLRHLLRVSKTDSLAPGYQVITAYHRSRRSSWSIRTGGRKR